MLPTFLYCGFVLGKLARMACRWCTHAHYEDKHTLCHANARSCLLRVSPKHYESPVTVRSDIYHLQLDMTMILHPHWPHAVNYSQSWLHVYTLLPSRGDYRVYIVLWWKESWANKLVARPSIGCIPQVHHAPHDLATIHDSNCVDGYGENSGHYYKNIAINLV